MSTPQHDQVRYRRLARLIIGTAGVAAVSAARQRRLLSSIAASLSGASAPAASASSSAITGDDPSTVGRHECDHTQASG